MSQFFINMSILCSLNILPISIGIALMLWGFGDIGIILTLVLCFISSYFVLLFLPTSGKRY